MASNLSAPAIPDSSVDTSSYLIKLIKQIGNELKLQSARLAAVNMDSSFDSDLGLDSLTRMELLNRIETEFGVSLPETVYFRIETPRDLLREILLADPQKDVTSLADNQFTLEASPDLPFDANTLVDALIWHCEVHPDRPHIKFYREHGEGEVITYRDIRENAEQIAIGLQHQGLAPKQSVTIMLPTGKSYFYTFFGVLIAGGIPVPIYPPTRLAQIEDHLIRHKNIIANSQARILVTFREAIRVAQLLKSHVESLRSIVTPEKLISANGLRFRPKLTALDIAFLQYTSGSTGVPKGVTLTHHNLLTNIRAMGQRTEIRSTDVFVSWLPLYHDMGLIGAWLGSLYFGTLLVIMSPLYFLSRPERWLWAIHRYRGSFTAAPNFAYELCLKRVDREAIKSLDLSSLRAVFNGAEPVSPKTLERFIERFEPYGFRRTAFMPVYGLAESSVGLAFPPIKRGPRIDQIGRESFIKTGNAIISDGTENALRFVSCGQPLVGHEIRVVDSTRRELPERHQGRLQFRGPSATSGYFRNPEKTQSLFDGEWLDSGDLAYIADGEVFITSRIKDLVIHGGRNIYPQELEESVGDIAGIRKGCVAVFGSQDPKSGTERLIVIAETRETDPLVRKDIRTQINKVAIALLGSPPDVVKLVPPHTVLKTSSGKIRRSACRDLYDQGLIGKDLKSARIQFARLAIAAIIPELRRFKQTVSSIAYACYAWVLLAVFAVATWITVVLCPWLTWRWRIMRSAGRLLCFLTGTQLTIRGLENLAAKHRPYVIVSNHSSYLDGLILVLSIPMVFSFVAKVELAQQVFAGVFLRQINTLFVERFDKQQALHDAETITNVVKQGRSMLFFPEGTFTRMPGLLPFHMGAFLTATKTGLPVVPVAIRGTRHILRGGSWFPRRGSITATIGTIVDPMQFVAEHKKGGEWAVAIKIRDITRKQMLSHVHEPDLVDEVSPV